MNTLTSARFWVVGIVLAAVPAAALLQDYRLFEAQGMAKQVLTSYVTYRDAALSLLADGLTLLTQAVRNMEPIAINLILILLAFYLATLVSGNGKADDAPDAQASAADKLPVDKSDS